MPCAHQPKGVDSIGKNSLNPDYLWFFSFFMYDSCFIVPTECLWSVPHMKGHHQKGPLKTVFASLVRMLKERTEKIMNAASTVFAILFS